MTFVNELLPVVLPIIVAGLTTVLFEKFQQGITALEKSPAIVKQLTVAVLAYGLTKAAAVTGVALTSGDPAALTAQDFNALLSSGLAFLFHQGTKSKALAKRLGMFLVIVGLAACTPSPAVAAAPKPFGVALEVVGDTVKIVAPCTADAPAVRCRFVPAATIAGRAIVFGAVPEVALGQSATIAATFTAAGGDTLRVTTTSAGVNPEGAAGPATRSENEFVWVAPFGIPGAVRSFTITVTVVRP